MAALRQPLLLLALVLLAGFGASRAFRYGAGARRFLGALPIVIIVVGDLLVPFGIGILRGAGARPEIAGIGGEELLLVAVAGSLLLAAVIGAVLSVVFRPPRT